MGSIVWKFKRFDENSEQKGNLRLIVCQGEEYQEKLDYWF